MSTAPTVSVLMPVYNGEKYLAEAIKSILNQTFSDFEFIICNDASLDSSKAIIKKFQDKRINYIENEINQGIVLTRNKLFSLAKGEYFSIMDCDDIAYPRKLEKQISFMKRNSDYGLCGTWARMITPSNGVKGFLQHPQKDEYIRINMLFQSSFVQSTVVIRKETLGSLKYDDGFQVAEDYDLWERLSYITKMYNLPYFLLDYRFHENNISLKKIQLISEKRDQIIKRQLNNFCILDPEELKALISVGNFLPPENGDIHDFISKTKICFTKLIETNRTIKLYNHNNLISFLLYRWIFYCFFQKQYKYAFSNTTRIMNPAIFIKLLCLVAKKMRVYLKF
jgi:glycosyltransferase involved in cell wall biosynthesis